MSGGLPPLAMHRAAAARDGHVHHRVAASSQPIDFLSRLEAVEHKDTTSELWPGAPAADLTVAEMSFAHRHDKAKQQKRRLSPGNLDADQLLNEIQNDIARARKRNLTPPPDNVAGGSE